MIIELMLATALDLSLPEFQPEIDLSGNVIVSSIDEETDEIIAEEIPIDDIPIDENKTLLRSLETHTIESSVKSNFRISDGKLQAHSGDNLNYIYLTQGIEYTLYNINTINTSTTLGKGASVTTHEYSNPFTPSENCYLLRNNTSFYITYTTGEPDEPPVVPDDPSGNDPDDPSGNDPDDPSGNDPDIPNNTDYATLIDAVNDVYKSVNAIALILMFMAFCPFLTKVVDKLMFRKED